MNAPHLRLLDADSGELVEVDSRISDLEDQIVGLIGTVKSQSRTIGSLERKIANDDPEHHPQRKEITDLIERWKLATGHPKSKNSKDRFDVIRARLKDGYDLTVLELAIDGIGAYPFVCSGQRKGAGLPSQRHDSLSLALKGGENLERFANLGALARREQG